jgi:hypothetical protein
LNHSIGAIPPHSEVSFQIERASKVAAGDEPLRLLEVTHPTVVTCNVSDEIIKASYRSVLTLKREGALIARRLEFLLKGRRGGSKKKCLNYKVDNVAKAPESCL